MTDQTEATKGRAISPSEADDASDVLLSVRNVEASYGAVKALRGISLSLPSGEITALLGANGAGKTTLLKTMSAVIKTDKGQITLKEQRLDGLNPEAIVKAGVAHVPEGREIFPFLSVADNLMVGAYIRRDARQVMDDIDLVYEYFPILKEKSAQRACLLSGGQQQMLAIGRALMARPTIMLLDEPSLGLSPLLVQEIMAMIQRLNAERKMTVLLVEQNAQAALSIAHSGYVMEMGRIVMVDSAQKLRESQDVQEFYLGVQGATQRGQKRWKRRKTWR